MSARDQGAASDQEMVWIPAVPLPFIGITVDICGQCRKKFRFTGRRHRYELHYRREHQRGAIYDDRGTRLRRFAPPTNDLWRATSAYYEKLRHDTLDRLLADLEALDATS